MSVNYIYFGENCEECLRVERMLRALLPESEYYILGTGHEEDDIKHHYVRILFKVKGRYGKELGIEKIIACVGGLKAIEEPIDMVEQFGRQAAGDWWVIEKGSV